MPDAGYLTLPKMNDTEVTPSVWLIGEPTPVPDTNLMRCLARVGNALCLVELKVTFGKKGNDHAA